MEFKNSQIGKNIWKLAGLSTFGLLALGLVVLAQGYQIDPESLTLKQTGLLVLDFRPNKAILTIEGREDREIESPHAEQLSPGVYDIGLKKPGYANYQARVTIEAGLVSKPEAIFLVREQPLIEKIAEGPELERFRKIFSNFPTDPDLLIVDQSELWYSNRLITRLSGGLKATVSFSGGELFLIQINDELRLILGKTDSPQTGNRVVSQYDVLIKKLDSQDERKFFFQKAGREMILDDKGSIERITLQLAEESLSWRRQTSDSDWLAKKGPVLSRIGAYLIGQN